MAAPLPDEGGCTIVKDSGVEALLFDLGRVVIDIDFNRAFAPGQRSRATTTQRLPCWALLKRICGIEVGALVMECPFHA